MMADRPDITVVISTIGNHSVLRRVLDGYSRQDVPPSRFEVVVVMDRAEEDPDAVDAAIGERSYRVRRLTGRIPGLSANRNTGWQNTSGPVVLFTDNDTIPAPNLIREHLEWHRQFDAAEVALAGMVRWARGVRVTPFMRWLELGFQFDFGAIGGIEASWAHLYGANSSIKRGLLERVGGFDEERLPYGYEDLDWAYRAREHGLRVMFNRQAIVEHWRVMTVEDWKVRAPRLAASEWRFCELHPNVTPSFFTKLREAASLPPQRGRAAWLVRFVPRRIPYVGPLLWNLADIYWRQQIAPEFLTTWEAMAGGLAPDLPPAVSAIRERS